MAIYNDPDSTGPLIDGLEIAAATWSGADYNAAAALGVSLLRHWRVPVGATGGTLIIRTAGGEFRTLNVDPGDWLDIQFDVIDSASTVTAVWVGA